MNAAALLAQAAAPAAAADTDYLLYALLLLAGAFVMLVLELFLPSGGLLGVAGAIAALAAVGCFFAEDTTLGFAALLGLAVVTPVLLGLGLWIWPHTPIGRRLVLGASEEGGAEEGAGALPSTAAFRPAVGDVGETLSPLRRIGTVRFDGKRVECMAESGMIDPGVSVRVSRVSGNEVFVREA
ncbi:NfeD family protein [Phycisphaera mikurensis]|uniref:NfeD-like C-terminal domain-containing protein n=1 Tax=Phycisphaera mikurensis (strain NBRC 102666 / KCTC 22515 / FYK2301M01) TaxID=1142394 RepID=I0IIZ6_PHYMF|nr:NfeD family protein [Phycisphaera mikurensis]MBB6443081.1 membrane-bound ClpP family serine protease [Phycisphaera mikurensis]BAM05234.1 hypothetical protein PSMK_30750 [Phycisphaera mikurensis NBRC 102666]